MKALSIVLLCGLLYTSLADDPCDPEYHYQCETTATDACQCKNIHTLCDGIPDCENGEDEDPQFCKRQCKNHYGYWCTPFMRCLHRTDMCNGEKACKRRSDNPSKCLNVPCPSTIEGTGRGYTRCNGSDTNQEQCVLISALCASALNVSAPSPCVNGWKPATDDSICMTVEATIPSPTPMPTDPPTDAPTPSTTESPTPPTTPPASEAPSREVFVDCSMSETRDVVYGGQAVPIREVGHYDGGVSICEAAMYAHNLVRLNHHDTPPLIYDDQLAASAEAYAIEIANSNIFQHSTDRIDVGENLYYGNASGIRVTFDLADAVFGWYNEMILTQYNFDSGEGNGQFRHFAQVAWASTVSVGCGLSKVTIASTTDEADYTFVVCHYQGEGNIQGQYVDNVQQLRDDAVIPTGPRELEPEIGLTGYCLQQAPNCHRYSGFCSIDWIADACSELCYPHCLNQPTDPPTEASTAPPTIAPTTHSPMSTEASMREVFVDCSMSEPLTATYEGQAVPIREVGHYDGGVSVCEAALYAHNFVRLNHQDTSPLIYDDQLAASAEAYAIEIANNNNFQHSTGRVDVGENLYYGNASGIRVTFDLADAVFGWYNEMTLTQYDFDIGEGEGQFRHFTQAVWASTVAVGCGVSKVTIASTTDEADYTFVVCHYQGEGNIQGAYVDNVKPLREDAIIPTGPRELEPEIGLTGYCLQQAPNCQRYSGWCSIDWIANACSELCYPDCINAPTDPPTAAPTHPPTTTPEQNREVFVDCSMSEPLEATYEGSAVPIREVGHYENGVSVCEAAMYAHNLVRLNHQNTPPLIYDDQLAASAEAYAIDIANNNLFEHSTGRGNVGENLYYGNASGIAVTFDLADAVFGWYNEMVLTQYDFEAGHGDGGLEAYGHFTQLVWASSTSVGCGVSKVTITLPSGDADFTFVACHYGGAGNIQGQYVDNVKPLRDDAVIPTGPRELEPNDGLCILQARNCHRYSGWCSLQWIADACSEICYEQCQQQDP